MVNRIFQIKESHNQSSEESEGDKEIETEDISEDDKLAHERIQYFFDAFLKGYKNGEINLERMCKEFNKALKSIPLKKETPYLWQKIYMGKLVLQALDGELPKKARKTRGQPTEIRELCAYLVRLANEKDGYVINKAPASEEMNAYEKVAEIMSDYGFKNITENTVIKCCEEKSKKKRR